MNYLILLRHGQSQWNLENRFTGLTDIDLTEQGIGEAIQAGKIINKLSIKIDKIYSSVLKRASETAIFLMEQTNQSHLYEDKKLVMIKNPALNERDYGDLVGLNKLETSKKYGEKQVHLWRRSYDISPPRGESLKQVITRVGLYYKNNIKKNLELNKNIMIVAHGNSLRALLVCLGIYQPKEIPTIEFPTGNPYLIKLKDNKIISHQFIN